MTTCLKLRFLFFRNYMMNFSPLRKLESKKLNLDHQQLQFAKFWAKDDLKFYYDFTGVTGLLSNKYAIQNINFDHQLVKLLIALNHDVIEKNFEKYSKNFDAAVISKIIGEDIMKSHLESIKNELLERNLPKIIFPYRRCRHRKYSRPNDLWPKFRKNLGSKVGRVGCV
eukprot:maker-scaffold_8-snap-gene-11.37-mRNA-1 protein AED:0.23 eAED:0.61 QI:0/0/0/1/0/0/4/0/168